MHVTGQNQYVCFGSLATSRSSALFIKTATIFLKNLIFFQIMKTNFVQKAIAESTKKQTTWSIAIF